MRIALFSDVHGNLEALEACLADMKVQGCDALYCLGDLVGYGPDPSACIQRVGELGCPVLKGNHDHYAANSPEMERLSPMAQASVGWTRDHISEEEIAWLNALPLVWEEDDFQLVHASPDKPDYWTYIRGPGDASPALEKQSRPLCFIGHTHVPEAYMLQMFPRPVELDGHKPNPKRRTLVNVGSIGQPRDGDRRAAYVVWDRQDNELRLRRVTYDLGSVQAKIEASGLPAALSDRLAFGQ